MSTESIRAPNTPSSRTIQACLPTARKKTTRSTRFDRDFPTLDTDTDSCSSSGISACKHRLHTYILRLELFRLRRAGIQRRPKRILINRLPAVTKFNVVQSGILNLKAAFLYPPSSIYTTCKHAVSLRVD